MNTRFALQAWLDRWPVLLSVFGLVLAVTAALIRKALLARAQETTE